MAAKVTGLGHVGLFVHDMPKMLDFYTTVLGMTVTDRGGERIVFLSARPGEEHHELALVKNPDRKSDPQQVSFTVDSLADLRGFWQGIKQRGYKVQRVLNHGNAIGCYFHDPEGVLIEAATISRRLSTSNCA